MIKMGKEQPVASMDQSGKIIWARHTEIQMVNVKSATGEAVADGERLPLVVKELGNCEVTNPMLICSFQTAVCLFFEMSV